jgi:hypothetical protein
LALSSLHSNVAPAAGVAVKLNLAVVAVELFFGPLVIFTLGAVGFAGAGAGAGVEEPELDELPVPPFCSSGGGTGSAVAAVGGPSEN